MQNRIYKFPLKHAHNYFCYFRQVEKLSQMYIDFKIFIFILKEQAIEIKCPLTTYLILLLYSSKNNFIDKHNKMSGIYYM